MKKTKGPDTNLNLAGLYHDGLLKDYVAMYPADQLEAKRDSKRIALELQYRGLAFFTLDLPEMGKILDQSITARRLVEHNVPCFGRKCKSSPLPRLFWGLWNRLFDCNGLLLDEPIDPNAALMLRTLLYACKKLRMDCKPQRVYDAVKEYFDVDGQIRRPSALWEDPLYASDLLRVGVRLGDDYLPDSDDRLGLDVPHNRGLDPERLGRVSDVRDSLAHIQRVAGSIASRLGLFDPSQIAGRHGPGAVAEHLTWRTKYVFPTWSARLSAQFPWDEHGITTVDNFLQDGAPLSGLVPSEVEGASNLLAVPKTQKGPRLIAAEPVCNQWIQQGVAHILRKRVADSLLGLSIDFFDQEPSRAAALAASSNGRRATIDLSSASDRLSTLLVEQIFASNESLLRMLSACRTRYLTNTLDKKQPSLLKLAKFASMGSALTFPIQSVVFAILAIGTGSYLNPKRRLASLAKEVRVFGDDIIVPVEWVETLIAVLSAVGLKVNAAKTHTEGNFRESCGMDAWHGYDVTPAYVRWPSTQLYNRSAIGYVAVSNNFFLKGFWHTAKYLDDAADWMRKLPAVNARAAAYGRSTFCHGLDPVLKIGWDHGIQQEVVKVPRVKRRGSNRFDHITNPNGMMEYSVRSRGRDYSWRGLFDDATGDIPMSTILTLPPEDANAVVRVGRVPTYVFLRTDVGMKA